MNGKGKFWALTAIAACLGIAPFITGSGKISDETMAFIRPEVPVIPPPTDSLPPFLNQGDRWADSLMKTMSLDERIGQLFMVAAYSKYGIKPNEEIESLIANYHIGGLIFMQGGPGRQAILNNHYQKKSKIPLMIAIDGEWGLSMRLDSTMRFPWPMTLGAIQDQKLVEEVGAEIGRQCKRVGIHVNFAPVVDVNNNPANPVINQRSFGEVRENVALKGIAFTKGLQSQRVLASAKHFPGHGDTDKDSHKGLPVISHNRSRLDSIELWTFKQLIKNGVGSVMIGHLSIPALDPTPNLPSSLSPTIITDILRKEMGFEGLIFSDAMNMKGVSDYYKPGVADCKALMAGMDMVEFSADVPTGVAQIKAALASGEMTETMINEKCKRVLKAKYWMGLSVKPKVSLKNLAQDLYTPQADLVLRKAVQASLTLVKNDQQLIPFKGLDTAKIASVAIGAEAGNMFQKRLNDYTQVSRFILSDELTTADGNAMIEKLKGFSTVIISYHKSNASPWKNYKLTDEAKQFIQAVNQKHRVVLVGFANPYSLLHFQGGLQCEAVVMAYQNSDYAMDYTAQLLFGGVPALGKLPVTIGPGFPAGAGVIQPETIRLKYSSPEDVGIERSKLDGIEKIVQKSIKDSVFPGCQILVAKNGTVFFQEAYGYQTYTRQNPVTNDHLYDIASITKIAGTLPAIMKLVDQQKIALNKRLIDYLPELIGTNKANITLIDMLTHQAGFKAWIPFHLKTLTKDYKWIPGIYDTAYSADYPLKVAHKMYARNVVKDSIYAALVKSDVNARGNYLYSDLGYYFLMRIVAQKSGLPLDQFLYRNFTHPLGAWKLRYNPTETYETADIAPTEYDKIFRKQQIQGTVHDQGAALMGGVAGHAGLFSNSNDLAKLMQMYLNMGHYGGEEYITDATLKEFTKCQYCANGNRRGIGFDKPSPGGEGGTACDCVSYLSFGHAGFTGTLVWADPSHDLVYIFLSNRVYPDAENKKLIKQETRAQIQQIIYNAL